MIFLEIIENAKKNKKHKIIDSNYVSASHTSYMSIAPEVLNKMDSSIAVVGVGGGGLCLLLRKLFPKSMITGIDIDPVVIDLAKNYFGLITDEKLKIVIEDGVKFIKKSDKFDVVIFDVNSSIQGADISCPPPEFLEEKTLEDVKKLIGETGKDYS